MAQRAIRFFEATDKEIQAARRKRGFSSPRALIRHLVEQELSGWAFRDDGGGIPPEVLQAGRSGHYGLSGMRERARQIGASLNIWSGIGTGTEIDLTVPGSIAYSKSRPRSRLQLFRKKVG